MDLLIDQASDGPSIILKIKLWVAGLNLGPSKLFILIFVKFCQKLKGFLQRILQEIMKKIILGTSDAWSMKRLFHQPSNPAYYIEDCWISKFCSKGVSAATILY